MLSDTGILVKSTSRLLNLPAELRHMIWIMVLGNQTIHIEIDQEGEIRPSICTSWYSEMQAYEISTSGNPDTKHFGIISPHSTIRATQTNFVLRENHSSCNTLIPLSVTLNASALRTCKMIYSESGHTLYTANTFAFRNPKAFKRFFTILEPSRRKNITSMAIFVKWEDNKYGPHIHWNEVLYPKLVQQLTGLRTFYLQFNEYFKSHMSFMKAAIAGGWVAENFLYFSKLPLKTVAVIVTLTESNAWTVPLVARQNQAETIRFFLTNRKFDLDPISDCFGMCTPPWPQVRKRLWQCSSQFNIHGTHLSVADSHFSITAPLLRPTSKDSTFQPLKTILGKLRPTRGSVLPSIRLNIREPFTSWGRGFSNTIIFPNGYDNRVPRYAFKLVLWKQGLSINRDQPLEQDMSFWISTDATCGIKINGVLLKRKNQGFPARNWSELRHGDKITVWTMEKREVTFIKLRFRCYFGASCIARPRNILRRFEVNDELDEFCLRKESELKAKSFYKWEQIIN